jgi:tetratricopeptide (TPR) repeat protein
MKVSQTRFAAILAAGVVFTTAATARADARADFEKAKVAFLARNWADAEEKLKALLDPSSGLKERQLISQTRMYLGAALLKEGKRDEAKDALEKLVVDDPVFEPDPLGYPGDAIDLFIDVRSAMLEQIKIAQQTQARLAAEKKAHDDAEHEAQRHWMEKVKAQAGEEAITVKHSRIVAAIPFGVGQFQNKQSVLGWIFLGGEVAALGGTLVTFGMERYANTRKNETYGDGTGRSPQWQNRALDIQVANLSVVGGFIGLAAIGIVQAELAYVPEVAETKKRDLPPLELPKTSAVISPIPNGAIFGASGRF